MTIAASYYYSGYREQAGKLVKVGPWYAFGTVRRPPVTNDRRVTRDDRGRHATDHDNGGVGDRGATGHHLVLRCARGSLQDALVRRSDDDDDNDEVAKTDDNSGNRRRSLGDFALGLREPGPSYWTTTGTVQRPVSGHMSKVRLYVFVTIRSPACCRVIENKSPEKLALGYFKQVNRVSIILLLKKCANYMVLGKNIICKKETFFFFVR